MLSKAAAHGVNKISSMLSGTEDAYQEDEGVMTDGMKVAAGLSMIIQKDGYESDNRELSVAEMFADALGAYQQKDFTHKTDNWKLRELRDYKRHLKIARDKRAQGIPLDQTDRDWIDDFNGVLGALNPALPALKENEQGNGYALLREGDPNPQHQNRALINKIRDNQIFQMELKEAQVGGGKMDFSDPNDDGNPALKRWAALHHEEPEDGYGRNESKKIHEVSKVLTAAALHAPPTSLGLKGLGAATKAGAKLMKEGTKRAGRTAKAGELIGDAGSITKGSSALAGGALGVGAAFGMAEENAEDAGDAASQASLIANLGPTGLAALGVGAKNWATSGTKKWRIR